MESEQVLNQAQRLLNLKKSAQPELHDFKMWRLGFKPAPEEPSSLEKESNPKPSFSF